MTEPNTPLDAAAMSRTADRLDRLTKPPGSLGRLEALAVQLAGIAGRTVTSIDRPVVLVFAGDHGVAGRGVTPYPAEVTRQMIAAFRSGRAAINVLASVAGADLVVVDVGVAGPRLTAPDATASAARFVDGRVRAGTGDLSVEAAMTLGEALAAVDAGRRVARAEIDGGADLIALGEMGIGNTTASSAIVAALTGRPAVDVTGPGTGLDDAAVRRKADLVDGAVRRHGLDPATDPLTVLRSVGGLEIAALVGALLEAAAAGVPVVLDGFITGAAALVASRIAPGVERRLIASHRSSEPGHAVVLGALGLEPLLELDLRLGEGSGAALAIPLARAAAAIVGGMATFDEAGVANRD